MEKASNYYNQPGADVLHEVMEPYIAGKIVQSTGVDAKAGDATYEIALFIVTIFLPVLLNI